MERGRGRGRSAPAQSAVQDENMSPPVPASKFHFESREGVPALVKFTVDESFPNLAPKDIRAMLYKDQSLELCKMTQVSQKSGAASSDSSQLPLDVDLAAIQKEIAPFVDEANKFGGHLSVRVMLGHSGFVVPRELADSVFALADVYELLERKRIAHFMINQLPAETAESTIDYAKRFFASNKSEWTQTESMHNIMALYSDQLIGRYNVAHDGTVAPESNPPPYDEFLKGDGLNKRCAAVIKVEDNGRILLPECSSADFRIYGERTVETQRTTRDAVFASRDGFFARVTDTKEFDHKVKRRLPDASQFQVVLDRKSLHQEPKSPPSKGEHVYVVYVGVFLCPGQPCDFQLLLSEHAPEEDTPQQETISTLMASRLLYSGMSDARAIVAET